MCIAHKNAEELSAIIKRLKMQKATIENDSKEAGRCEGYEDASTMCYAELTYATNSFLDGGNVEAASYEDVFKDDMVGDYFVERQMLAEDRQESCCLSTFEDVDENGRLGASLKAYVQGWIEGTQEFWNEVKEAL